MAFIIICCATIFGVVASVLMQRWSANRSSQAAPAVVNDPTNPDTTIIHNIRPDEANAKPLYEVFSWGREAWAEYLYYGEIDSSALCDDGTGDLSKNQFFAEVNVSFEADTLEAERQNLQNYRKTSVRTPKFSLDNELDIENFSQLTPAEILNNFQDIDHHSLISISDTDYCLFNIGGPFSTASFQYTRVEASRVTTIYVQAKADFVTIEWMYERFNQLLNEYQHLPMQTFSGAVRD